MAFVKILVVLLAAQSVVYLCVLMYLRAARRERLEQGYPDVATPKERSVFVDAGVDAYQRWLAPRLAACVYGLPLAILAVIVLVGANTG